MRRLIWLALFICVAGLMDLTLTEPASAAAPTIDAKVQVQIKEALKARPNSAYAIGENNIGAISSGHVSAQGAIDAALNACNLAVDEQLKRTESKTCKLVTINSKNVWQGTPIDLPKSAPIVLQKNDTDFALPNDSEVASNELALKMARTIGDIENSKALVLRLQGCARELTDQEWVVPWLRYFAARKFYFVQLDAYADHNPVDCDAYRDIEIEDAEIRIRIGQTLRAVTLIREHFPNLPIYIWGHGLGAKVAQAYDFGATAVILTGTTCKSDVISRNTPVLFVVGENDKSLDFEPRREKITARDISSNCKAYVNNPSRRAVIVTDGNERPGIWYQNVIDAVSELVGEPSSELALRKYEGLLSAGRIREVIKFYNDGSRHKALAIRPGTSIDAFANIGNESKHAAEQTVLADCERGGGFAAYYPNVPNVCELAMSE